MNVLPLLPFLSDPDEARWMQPLLRSVQVDPADRLRYLEWLRHRPTPRGEAAGLLLALAAAPEGPTAETQRARLAELWDAAPPQWWSVVSTAPWIVACGDGAAPTLRARFATRCPAVWESMTPSDTDQRACRKCGAAVRCARTRREAEQGARAGAAIAVAGEAANEVVQLVSSRVTGHPDYVRVWSDEAFTAGESAPSTLRPGPRRASSAARPQAVVRVAVIIVAAAIGLLLLSRIAPALPWP